MKVKNIDKNLNKQKKKQCVQGKWQQIENVLKSETI